MADDYLSPVTHEDESKTGTAFVADFVYIDPGAASGYVGTAEQLEEVLDVVESFALTRQRLEGVFPHHRRYLDCQL